MLLWINLIMDAFAAIALGTEPPIPMLVKGDPRMQTALLKQKQVLRQIIGVSIWNVIVIVLVFLFGASASGLPSFSYFQTLDATRPDDCPLPKSTVDFS